MTKTRWVLVSDASRALLFRDEGGFQLIEKRDHPDSRARARDLMADANGRKAAGPSVGGNYGGRSVSLGVGRPGVEPDTDPKEVEAEKFAHELVDVLEQKLNTHEYDSLVLVAPPHFLGLLRNLMSKEVTKHVEASLDKNLTKMEPREIEGHVRAELAA